MKTHIIIPALGASLLLVSCAGTTTTTPSRAAAAREEKAEFDRTTPPRLGMTREQVLALYGRPKFRSQSPRGEVWNYTFDGWMHRVPYANLAAKVKTGTVTFGADGRVVDFHWGQSRSAFMMGM